jgi:hypothetical protein
MHKRSFLMTVATGLLACGLGTATARAGTVDVTEYGGTYNFTLTANGSGGVTINYSLVELTQINDAVIPGGPIASQLGIGGDTFTVASTVSAPPFTSYAFNTPTPILKNFGVGGIDTASVSYVITSGTAINPSFLNLSGHDVAVIAPLMETTTTSPTIYDFSAFGGGVGLFTRTLTQAGVDFASIIADGGTVTGTGGFTDVAPFNSVPEPQSMALLGIGMTAVIAIRRYFKRSVAA